MRSTTVLGLMLTLAAPSPTPVAAPQAASKGSVSQRPLKQYSMEQFMATTTVNGASFSADGRRILFSSNESGIFNVYSMPVGGGKPEALTKSTTDSTFAISYFPHDDRILYTRDVGGNEQNHLYVLELGGKERDLTPGGKLKARFGNWSQDGHAFFVLTNERDGRFFDLYRYDTKTYERTLFYKEEKGYQVSGGSNDEKWVALAKVNTTSDSDIFLYNVSSQEFKHLTPHTEPSDYTVASFDPTSEWLYYLTNDGGEFTRIRRYHLASGRHEEVDKSPWDISYSYFSHHGRYRVTGVNDDGRTVITVIDNKTGKAVPLPKLPAGEITSVHISRDERQMAFYLNGDRAPNNLYVYNFSTAQASKVTDTLNKEIDPLDLVESDVVRFKSFDGLTTHPFTTSRIKLPQATKCLH
jgi:dipeptidyl aminopeptidase/acylaminoacyl peptidase